MKIAIEFDEQRVKEIVEQLIAEKIISEYQLKRDADLGVRDGVNKAVQEHIYSRKDDIIERVIERAAREIIKKGLPKMLERLGKVDERH